MPLSSNKNFLDKRQAKMLADIINRTCGYGSILHISDSNDNLIFALRNLGFNAHRFTNLYDFISLPKEEIFNFSKINTIILDIQAGNFPDESYSSIFKNIFNITNNLFLNITLKNKKETKQNHKDWWESVLIEQNFRKHPRYFSIIDYNSIDNTHTHLNILMEKLPPEAIETYPISALKEERDLHMDMSREAGRRSDAHLIRYFEAAKYIRPGDRVLDAACGLGYGASILLQNSLAKEVIGIDGSEYAIDYANIAFSLPKNKASFKTGFLPEKLSEFPDAHFDFIVSFETLEHLEDPDSFLKECFRVLSPGGRIIASVPNNWAEADGKDPNPFHYHVYTWPKILQQMRTNFIVEKAFAQSASRKKEGSSWVTAHCEWRELESETAVRHTCEWCLVLGMKDPNQAVLPQYRETLFPISNSTEQVPPVIDFKNQYTNPWLVRSMISIGLRMTDSKTLSLMAHNVLTSTPLSADAAAALCVEAYQALDQEITREEYEALFSKMEQHIACGTKLKAQAIDIRWAASLLFVRGLIEQKLGLMNNALNSYEQCALIPFEKYSPLLATKIIEAAYRLGEIYYQNNDKALAKKWWNFGVSACLKAIGNNLLSDFKNSEKLPDFVFRELTEVLDITTRCATALSEFDKLSDNLFAIERVQINKKSQIQDLNNTMIQVMNNVIVQNKIKENILNKEISSLKKEIISKNELIYKVSKELKLLMYWRPRYRWVLGYLRRRLFKKPFSLLNLLPNINISGEEISEIVEVAEKNISATIPPIQNNHSESIRLKELIYKTVSEAETFEAQLLEDTLLQDIDALQWGFSINTHPFWSTWHKISQKLSNNIKYVVCIPWLVKGGADLVAINILKALIQKHGSEKVLLVITDYGRMDAKDWLPSDSQWICLSDFSPELSEDERQSIIEALIFSVNPKSVINVNSKACWNLYAAKGKAFSNYADLYACLFCRDYSKDGIPAGYSDTHFIPSLDNIKGVYFDNETFLKEMVAEFNISPLLQKKLSVLRQPTNINTEQFPIIETRPKNKVLWAGRFCSQKNISVLIDIINNASNFQFDIYGSGDKEYEDQLIKLAQKKKNVTLKGSFKAIESLPINNYSCLLFTSLWEGMPTTLLIAGAMGIPVIASNVGGISELINSETGWLIDEYKDYNAYIQALTTIELNSKEATERSKRLQEKIMIDYSWDSFLAQLSNDTSFMD